MKIFLGVLFAIIGLVASSFSFFSASVIPPTGQPPVPLAPMLIGNGTDGQRVQAVFVYRSADGNRLDQAWVDTYNQFEPQPPGTTYRQLIQHEANYIDAAYLASAQLHDPGSFRRVRWVTDSQGNVDVQAVQADSGIGSVETFAQLGHHADRLYIAWLFGTMPASCSCSGLAPGFTGDDQFGPANKNNIGDRYAVGSWSGPGYPAIAAHELTHLLGAVNWTAPHASGGAHDCAPFQLMFPRDGECPTDKVVYCTTDTWDTRWLLDSCGDDYFNPSPVAGSYLASHWNVANSVFLAGATSTPTPTPTPTPSPSPSPSPTPSPTPSCTLRAPVASTNRDFTFCANSQIPYPIFTNPRTQFMLLCPALVYDPVCGQTWSIQYNQAGQKFTELGYIIRDGVRWSYVDGGINPYGGHDYGWLRN